MVKDIVSRGESSFDELDPMIGLLTHVSVIVKPMKHFMSRLRQEKNRAKNKNRRKIKLKKEVLEDFNLHLKFLQIASSGINMYLLTFRKQPTHVYRADACPFGLGGYYSLDGRAWRWYIPFELRFRATVNMLEHLAPIIGPWLDILEGRLTPQIILHFGDDR